MTVIMTDEFLTITKERYKMLSRAELFLSMLEANGVSSWEGYDIAWDAYEHLVKECPDVNG